MRRPIFWLLTLAFILRVGFWHHSYSFVLFRHPLLDASVFHEWAKTITAGDVWSRGQGDFLLSPLYAYLLAIGYRIAGVDIRGITALQLGMVGLMTVWWIYWIGKKIGGAATGWVAALLWSCYGPAWVIEGSLITGSWIVLFNLGVITSVMKWQEEGKAGWMIGAGICAGASFLLRPNVLAWFPFLLGGIWWWHSKELIRVRKAWVGFTVGLIVIFIPLMVRNARVLGSPGVSFGNSGMNFFIGNHRGSTGQYHTLAFDPGVPMSQAESFRQRASEESRRSLDRGESSGFWWRKTTKEIVVAPGSWAMLLVKKFLLVWSPRDIPMNVSVLISRRQIPWLDQWGVVQSSWLIMAAVVGLVCSMGDWRKWALVYGYFVGYLMALIVMFISAEYRFPLMPVLAIFAGFGVIQSWEFLKRKEWMTLGTKVILPAMGVWGISWCGIDASVVNRELSEEYTKMGVAHLMEHDANQAVLAFREGLSFDPRNGALLMNMGRVHELEIKNYSRSIEYYKQALDTNLSTSEREQVWMGIGKSHVQLKQWTSAGAAFREIVSHRPSHAVAWQYLGNVEYSLGNRSAAAVSWRESLKWAPENPGLRKNLNSLEEVVGQSR